MESDAARTDCVACHSLSSQWKIHCVSTLVIDGSVSSWNLARTRQEGPEWKSLSSSSTRLAARISALRQQQAKFWSSAKPKSSYTAATSHISISSLSASLSAAADSGAGAGTAAVGAAATGGSCDAAAAAAAAALAAALPRSPRRPTAATGAVGAADAEGAVADAAAGAAAGAD